VNADGTVTWVPSASSGGEAAAAIQWLKSNKLPSGETYFDNMMNTARGVGNNVEEFERPIRQATGREAPPPPDPNKPPTGPGGGEGEESEEDKLLRENFQQALERINENLSSEGNEAQLKTTNAYESGKALRQLSQALAGRGMSESGVGAEMGGQLSQSYSRDLADELMKSQQLQFQNANQAAQLMFGDRWNKSSQEFKLKMQKVLLKHQKELAAYLNKIQQGNPGVLKSLIDDIWSIFE
jgi:hypothetical protein